MRVLWLTLADPLPATNGQFIYSHGLIQAAAGAGLQLAVAGLRRLESQARRGTDASVRWYLCDDEGPGSAWRGSMSLLPRMVQRSRTPNMVRAVTRLLGNRDWDAIVFDSFCMGWALPEVLANRGRAALVYLSHNHETTAALHVASTGNVLQRVRRGFDAMCVWRLERALVRAADLITANTPPDCAWFAREAPCKPVHFIPPGYGGRHATRRSLGSLPRRAVIVGSFDWLAKRASLEAFLEAACVPFAANSIELQVVGAAEPRYLDGLRRRYAGVSFTGAVPEVDPYMNQARIALVPDLLGGFKLKSLDYVFNRLPIFAMRDAVPGLPLKDGRDVRLFDSHAALADGVVTAIDDIAGLDAQQEMAYRACAGQFDWREIGRDLADAVRAACLSRSGRSSRGGAATSVA